MLGAGAAVAAGLSSWAALSTPFSASAEAVTAIALGLLGALALSGWRRPVAVAPSEAGPGALRARWWPWAALGTAVIAWEFLCYSLGPRVDHPTLSSLYDSATTVRAVKGVFFFGWLYLGAALVRR